ncbi:MAG: hypothetical protein DRO14_05145 [Thermoprotei archaeon]|nr:MAG: hypothetical protein DRO14_05145 [Thermoprotei archaeon]
MVSATAIYLPRNIIERLCEEARKLGLSLEEYILELVLQSLDSFERVREYINAAKNLLDQTRKELEKGDIRRAAEKIWGATALAVKAYAEWKEGRRLVSHRDLWEYKRKIEKELGEWVYDSWMAANGMRTCFYEGWCSREDVEEALKRVSRLIEEIEKKVKT